MVEDANEIFLSLPIPAVKDLDIKQRQENYITASFIHPLIQALFSLEFSDRVAYCSNTVETEIDGTNKRPDYVVDVYEHYEHAHTSCYGEVKNDTSTIWIT